MLKNKDFKTIFCSAGNLCYQRKVVPQVNMVIPPIVNRLISVGQLRAVAIKHLVELHCSAVITRSSGAMNTDRVIRGPRYTEHDNHTHLHHCSFLQLF